MPKPTPDRRLRRGGAAFLVAACILGGASATAIARPGTAHGPAAAAGSADAAGSSHPSPTAAFTGLARPVGLDREMILEPSGDDAGAERGRLGVSLRALDEELAGVLGAPNGKGALVVSVEPDSPAARAGLRPGDILVSAAGEPVQETRGLAAAVAKVKPGSTLTITVLRGGRSTELRVAVGDPGSDRVTQPN